MKAFALMCSRISHVCIMKRKKRKTIAITKDILFAMTHLIYIFPRACMNVYMH